MEVIVINIPTIRRTNIAEIAQNVRQTMTNLKNSENNRSHTETSYKRLLELSPIGIFILDMTGVIRFCNPAAYKEGGYSEEEFIGKHFSEVVSAHGGEKASYNKIFKSIINGEAPKPFEFTYKRKDSTTGYAEIHASLLDEEGIKLGILVYKIDINERKWLEGALREERDKANMYLDIAGVILMVVDSDKTVKNINRKGCKVLGYNEEEIKGKNWFDNFIPPRLRRDVSDVYQQLMSGEIAPVEYYENPILTRNGEEKIIAWHNTVLRDEHGNIVGVLSSGEDITERRQAEEVLRIKESAIASSINGIAIADIEGNLTYVNDSFLKMWGYYDEQQVLGKPAVEFWQNKDKASEVVEALNDRVNWIGELVGVKEDGSLFDIQLSASMVKDEAGKPICMMAAFVDITERKKIEEQVFRLSSAVSLSTDYIVITDFDAKIIDVNSKTIEMFGADSKEELIGRYFLELVAPAQREMVSMDLREIMEKGYLECREYHIISKNGREIPMQMSSSLVKAADGAPLGLVRVGREFSKLNELYAKRRKTGRNGHR